MENLDFGYILLVAFECDMFDQQYNKKDFSGYNFNNPSQVAVT